MIIITLLQIIWSNHRLKQGEHGVIHDVRRLDVASAIRPVLGVLDGVIYFIVTR